MSRFADVTSDTPHGPHPVPEGHVPTDDAPQKRGLSPILMLGGLGLALTIGALAARAATGAIGNGRERPRHAPGFAALDPEAQRAMRARAQADFADYDERAAELRAAAMRARRQEQARRRRKGRRSGFGDDIGNAARNIAAVVTAASAALEAFRQVSAHSDEIMRDFSASADRLRDFLGGKADAAQDAAQADHSDSPQAADGSGDRRAQRM